MSEATQRIPRIAFGGLHIPTEPPPGSRICESLGMRAGEAWTWKEEQSPQWEARQEEAFRSLIANVAEFFVEQHTLAQLANRINGLEDLHRSDFGLLHERVKALEEQSQQRSIATCINSLELKGAKVAIPIPVAIHASGDEYIATFFDANISSGGDTPQEAFHNLCDILVAKITLLASLTPEQLGREPARQLAVIREFVAME